MAPSMAVERDLTLSKLELACSDLRKLLKASSNLEQNLEAADHRFDLIEENLSNSAKRVADLQTMAMSNKALESRINRAVAPALAVLQSFKLTESLQNKLLGHAAKLAEVRSAKSRLKRLLRYVDSADRLKAAIESIGRDGEPAIQKLQEVVEFLSRTKATDQFRTERLKETLLTLKAVYETEVEAMKFDGLLDQALVNLQDEFESILQRIRHRKMGEQGDQMMINHKLSSEDGDDQDRFMEESGSDLGTELELQVLKRIAETLDSNDCLDICIDIFVKVRYRRAAKALMRLNPDYLRTYTTEEINRMEWENLETSISLWIQHFHLAVNTVFVSEKKLCRNVLGAVMDGLVWEECFVKIADKIMAVFFRFGEGVARSTKEPQKLFKLLDMFASLESLKPELHDVFNGEPGAGICARFRELEKLLVHASTKVFAEFGLQIEGNSDGFSAPQDGSIPKLVRYALNYLKILVAEEYSSPMAKVFQTEHIWKAGILSSKPEPDQNDELLREAIANVMEALQRNIEAKRSRIKDKTLSYVFAMNTHWYIYMRTKNTELSNILGEQYMKINYKNIAEESAYMYQKHTWGTLVRILEQRDEFNKDDHKEITITNTSVIRGKIEAFLRNFQETCDRHRGYYKIPDADLREQIKEATLDLVVCAYEEFLDKYSSVLPARSFLDSESLQGMLVQVFDSAGDLASDGRMKRRGSKDRGGRKPAYVEQVDDVVEVRRQRFSSKE